ncbi:MAG: hypothetical protein J0H02_21370 [Armatimonadetes bacterium]|nr:hypothetical protein [Armatimonadota bacterium]
MKLLLKSALAAIVSLSLSTFAMAGHWKVRSMDESILGSTTSGPDVTRHSGRTATVTLPALSVYGSGPFAFYGEEDDMFKKITISNPGMVSYIPTVDSYYTYIYEWVPDLPTDVPPSASVSSNVYGYSLERMQQISQTSYNIAGTVSLGLWGWNALFNVQALWTGSGPGMSPFFGMSYSWPPSSGYDPDTTVIVDGARYYVRPVIIGSAVVSVDANGYTIATMTVLNALEAQIVSYLTASAPATTIGTGNTAKLICYKGGAEFLGLTVTP